MEVISEPPSTPWGLPSSAIMHTYGILFDTRQRCQFNLSVCIICHIPLYRLLVIENSFAFFVDMTTMSTRYNEDMYVRIFFNWIKMMSDFRIQSKCFLVFIFNGYYRRFMSSTLNLWNGEKRMVLMSLEIIF